MCTKRLGLTLLFLLLNIGNSGRADTLFHWRFDGSFEDEIISDADIVNSTVAYKFRDTGNPSPVYDVSYGTGNSCYNTGGTSAQFDNDPAANDPGVGLYVRDPGTNCVLDLSTINACTIEAFVYPYVNDRQSVIIRKYDGGVYFIDTRPSGNFAVRLAGGGQDIGDGGGICYDLTVDVHEWQHVALLWDGSVVRFYKDGAQSQDLGLAHGSAITYTGGIDDSIDALGIGCICRNNDEPPSNSGQFFHGRIDEVRICDQALEAAEFLLYGDQGLAWNPRPGNHAENVHPDVTLVWSPGNSAASHDVYLGTDFDDVNDGTDPNSYPGRGRLDTNSYDPPGDLAANTTFYWRVDEVGDSTFVKGDVWSFRVSETLVNSLGMEFVPIEAGSFVMGSENGDFDEVPTHNVTITQSFYMSRYEVTNAQYEQFDPAHSLIDHRGFSHEPNEAVIFVSWEDANAFCQWLRQVEGLPYRLPTEAEWEYACRAGTTTAYHTGGTLPPEFYKNAEETWGPEAVPLYVGQTAPNPWGLYDMHGNVEEWCYDWYGPYEDSAQIDPVGRVDGDFRVCRGGSHSTTVNYLRSANRMGTLPEDKHWIIGFRPVIGDMPATAPLPEPPPELYQTGVSQTVPPDINDGPDPNIPYFEGPRTYVKIPPGSYGPLFSAHNHDPGFTHCNNGDLLAIWYSTVREPGRELALAASRLRYGQNEWEDASPFWDAPDRNDHAPAMWIDGNGKIYQFCGLADAATWGGLAVIMRTSTDNGATWSRAELIAPEHTYEHMPVESVFRTNEGVILLPLDKNPGSHVLLSYDNGQSWSAPGGRIYGIHAGVTQLNDDRLMAFGRGDNIDSKMPKSLSSDLGASWSYSASQFPPISGGQRLILRRLTQGPILFISFTGSAGMLIDGQQVYGMFAALSYDEGQTWPVKKLLTAGGPPRQYDGGGNTGLFTMDDTHAEPRGYLAMTQTSNKVIHLISSALYYKFNLAWLEHKQYLLVDDFESYTDPDSGNLIADTWQDNRTDADNGTLISLDTSIVRGYKSMKVHYDTAWPYSRAVRTYAPGQNWTENNIRAVSLWFYGDSGNLPTDQMYVLLADTGGSPATFAYAGEPNDVTEEGWQQWHIDLQDFSDSGLDLTEVNTIAVGVSGAGAGDLYFDDIRLYPRRCIVEYGPRGDLTEDCKVDFDDVKVLSGDWLESEKVVGGVPPDANGLLLWYKFDEAGGYTATDYSGRNLHGTVDGPEAGWDPAGGFNDGCRAFNDDTAVAVPTDVLTGVGSEITFAVWLNGAYRADSDNWIFDTGSGDFFLQAAVVTATGLQAKWRAGYAADDVVLWDLDGRNPQELAGEWHHWTFVKDATAGLMQIYYDCLLEAETDGALSLPGAAVGSTFDIGAIISHRNDFIGKMDDFKIYDYALSQAEIVGAASGAGDLFVPAPDSDVFRDARVDFRDYAVLAGSWLQTRLWP